MELLKLCWEFFKTGLFAVGGGMATIPFLARMAETNPHWFTLADLADMIAVSESTPGPIGVNLATYAGFRLAGVGGAVATTLSLVLPSYIVLLLIAGALERYRSHPLVDSSFRALRPVVTGLIAAAGYTVLQMALLRDTQLFLPAVLLFVVLLTATQWKKLEKLHPIAYIGVAAAVGILFQF